MILLSLGSANRDPAHLGRTPTTSTSLATTQARPCPLGRRALLPGQCARAQGSGYRHQSVLRTVPQGGAHRPAGVEQPDHVRGLKPARAVLGPSTKGKSNDESRSRPKRDIVCRSRCRPAAGSRNAGLGPRTSPSRTPSPQFFELEREAVFRRSWLHVGRTSQIPEPGDYFTKELPTLSASLIVAHGEDGVVRAFHNICSHRGNKLVWDDHPSQEVCGKAKRFTCKYHNWQYDTAGTCRQVNMKGWFFDLDMADYSLVGVPCDVWEGFIFVNLDKEPRETLTESWARSDGASGYPFGLMTHMYRFRSEINANWKLFEDAFQEQYHGIRCITSSSTNAVPDRCADRRAAISRSTVVTMSRSTAVPAAAQELVRPPRPMERIFEASLWGQLDGPGLPDAPLPRLANPTDHPDWTSTMLHIYPNLDIIFVEDRIHHHIHLLADSRGPPHLRRAALLPAATECDGPARPRTLGGGVQGILPSGRQYT